MRRRILLPILVLLIAALGAFALVATAPSIESVTPERAIKAVRVMPAEPRDVRLWVRTQGTVVPRTESELVPEVSGRVEWVSPSLVSGGFFAAGDVLLRVEPHDYDIALARARANVSRAEGEAEYAASELSRQQGLSKRKAASVSQLADARRAATVSEAALEEARVALAQAERDRERTEIRAPFSGRVREERVDVGQFVSRGSMVATLYATDYAEIRLPIADRQLAFLHLPSMIASDGGSPGPAVRLRARFAGREHAWEGRIVRTEGEIDPKSRMVHVVARVEDPYGTLGEQAAGSDVPLAVGLFVKADIEGPMAEGVIVLPRSAMRNDSHILVVDADDRLHSREVEVLRIDREEVLIRAEVGPEERICISPLQIVVEGMRVRPIEEPSDAGAEAVRS